MSPQAGRKRADDSGAESKSTVGTEGIGYHSIAFCTGNTIESAECTRCPLEQSEERPASRVTHSANINSEKSGAPDLQHIFGLCD